MQRLFSNNEFTDKVRGYLLDKYCRIYKAEFYYCPPNNDHPDEYRLEWLENNQDKPMVMVGSFDNEDQFFTFVCKEIDARRFWLKQVFILQRTDKQGRT